MATKQKDTSHGKEKIGSSTHHHHLDSSHGRSPRTSKSSIPTSPDKVNHGLQSETTSYLKHTASSSNEPTSRLGKKPIHSDDNSPRFSRRKSFDKPPSPSQLQRTLSANSKDKSTPIKPSFPSPKTSISPKNLSEKSTIRSPKPSSERLVVSPKTASERISISRKTVSDSTSRTPRNVKTVQPVSTKPKPLKRTLSNSSSKSGNKSSPAPSVASSTAPTSPEAIEAPTAFEVEQEDKVILEQEVIEQEILKVEEEEEIPFEIPPDNDQILLDRHTDFSQTSKKDSFIEKAKVLDHTPTVLEEQEREEVLLPTPQIEETATEKTIELVENENQHEDEKAQVMIMNEDKKAIIEESSEKQFENNSVAIECQDEVETEAAVELEDEDKTAVKSMKELEGEAENEGTQKLKFKEREVVEAEEEAAKAEAENLSLRRQEVNKGKKESQAYNDVIEETASKLVQKRKNKVLALVGAFETVISLQEPEG